MSIQEFHSQLKQSNEQNSLMSALSRLSSLEDLTAVIERPVSPFDWSVWTPNEPPQ